MITSSQTTSPVSNSEYGFKLISFVLAVGGWTSPRVKEGLTANETTQLVTLYLTVFHIWSTWRITERITESARGLTTVHENPWESPRAHEDQRQCARIHENHRECTRINDSARESMRITESARGSTTVHENPWESPRAHEDQRQCTRIHENHRKRRHESFSPKENSIGAIAIVSTLDNLAKWFTSHFNYASIWCNILFQ